MSSLYTDNPGNHLTNFVFDIKTKKIHVINECFKTPNEALRSMYASGEERKDYFLCYRLNQYLIPKLSEKQLARCKKVIAHVKNNQGSRQQVAAMFHTPITDAIYINRLVKNSREIATDFCTSLTNTSSFFQSREEWNRRYVDPNSDPVIKQALPLQSNLLNINEITGLRFEAKIRHEPAYTIDAYCEFKSLNEAKEVADNLQQHNIISHIISVGDKSNHTYHLCIPAINVRNYATAIAEAKYVKLR